MYIFFLENYNSQETARRRRTASRCGPAPSPPSSPALPLVPSPPSERGSETQRRWNRRGAPPPPPPPAAAPTSPRFRICLEPSRSASQSGSRGSSSARGFSSVRLRGQLPLAGLGRLASKAAAERRAVCSRSARTHTSPPSLRVSGPCWDSGHQQLSGECGRRRGRGGAAEGCGPGRRATSSVACPGGRPPGSPLPPARSRARGGRERSLRRRHPAPSQEEAPLSGAGPARPPPLPGSGRAGGQVRAPRSGPGRQLPEGSSAGAGSETETKGKQKGSWAFLLFVRH
ncbi:unnamed protein product [Rangifer tarandus platyrhynchus]|uniref:Uncharacterized protein n=1 Tax=Rangifer tarandus platyrhynchus TaxID=3082113 RepID=A0ABN8ZNG9_RANTA|nr:unnamed protein product [Rangifer tarandus platyrhynchus]